MDQQDKVKVLSVKVPEDLWASIKHSVFDSKSTLQKWLVDAINAKLKQPINSRSAVEPVLVDTERLATNDKVSPEPGLKPKLHPFNIKDALPAWGYVGRYAPNSLGNKLLIARQLGNYTAGEFMDIKNSIMMCIGKGPSNAELQSYIDDVQSIIDIMDQSDLA
jgi:hypothetical protein